MRESLVHSLKESKKLLEFFIDMIEEGDSLEYGEIESIEHYLKALRCGCQCDDYNGVDCGCSLRSSNCEYGLIALKNILE